MSLESTSSTDEVKGGPRGQERTFSNSLKYLLCPVNHFNEHWALAAIYFEEKKICWYDSLGKTDYYKLYHLLQYLEDAHKACTDPTKGTFDRDEWELVPCPLDVPNQSNTYDCGVFLCMFADFIMNDMPLVFSQEHINKCRERIAYQIIKHPY